MPGELVTVRMTPFGRWMVCLVADPKLAWSGSRWVPIAGTVQVSNFEFMALAIAYALECGFALVSPADGACVATRDDNAGGSRSEGRAAASTPNGPPAAPSDVVPQGGRR